MVASSKTPNTISVRISTFSDAGLSTNMPTGRSCGREVIPLSGLLKGKLHRKHRPLKQDAIKELAAMPEWRQNFSAIASLVQVETGTESNRAMADRLQTVHCQKQCGFYLMFFQRSLWFLFALYYLDFVSENALICRFVRRSGDYGEFLPKTYHKA